MAPLPLGKWLYRSNVCEVTLKDMGNINRCQNTIIKSWWRHQMETFSALLAICERNPPFTGGFPSQRPGTRSFDVFVDVRLNKWLRCRWFKTHWRSLWRHCNVTRQHSTQSVGNMPPPSPRHLFPHVLQIMPRNPKYDKFQPKGHHNEENPQSMTKTPGNPKFYPFH